MTYRYQEEFPFSPVVKFAYLVLLGAFLVAVLGDTSATPAPVLLPLGVLLAAIPLLFGRLVIDVDEQALTVGFGYLGWPKKKIALSDIESLEVITYRPIRQFGGWGIRCGRFRGDTTGCYTIGGNRGVLLSLRRDMRTCLVRTRKFLVGSQEPERLLQALSLPETVK